MGETTLRFFRWLRGGGGGGGEGGVTSELS